MSKKYNLRALTSLLKLFNKQNIYMKKQKLLIKMLMGKINFYY